MKKLLLVFSHPDDESFATGGTIAKYVQSGWLVHYVCATRGEAGMTGPYGNIPSDSLGNIRQKEVEAAGTDLGISAITFLGFKDGMLSSLSPGELEEAIYKPMSAFCPDVVITFEPGGVSNHPDHIKISLSATFAFQKYALDAAVKHGEIPQKMGSRAKKWTLSEADTEKETHIEPRLYYACMPESTVDYLKKVKNLPAESFGKPWKGVPDKLITTVIDIKRFANKKAQALREHKTQQSDVDRFLSLEKQPMAEQEYFILRMQGIYEVFMGNDDRVANRL